MNGPTPAPVAAPSSNVACANPSRGKSARPNAMPFGNIPAVPAPTKSVATHSVAAGESPRRARSRSTSPSSTPNHPSVAPASACDAKTAFNGAQRRETRGTNRAAVSRDQNPDVSAAAAFASNAPRSIARVYIQLPYVTSVATERDTYAVNVAASVQRAREPDGAATERSRRRFGSARDRPRLRVLTSPTRFRDFGATVRIHQRRVRVLHLGGGGAVEVDASPRGG